MFFYRWLFSSFLCIFLIFLFFFHFFNQYTVNQRGLLALIVRKVRCVLSLAIAATGPVTCHNPILFAQDRERPVYQARAPGTFPSVQEIKGSQGFWSLWRYSPAGAELEGLVMPMLVSSDFMATGLELTMPRVATLWVCPKWLISLTVNRPSFSFVCRDLWKYWDSVCALGLELQNEE